MAMLIVCHKITLLNQQNRESDPGDNFQMPGN